MKTVTFLTVAWKYENEKYEHFSMDTEMVEEFEEYVQRNLGKIIQSEEVPFNECTQEFQTQAEETKSDLTDTEKMISKSGNQSTTK